MSHYTNHSDEYYEYGFINPYEQQTIEDYLNQTERYMKDLQKKQQLTQQQKQELIELKQYVQEGKKELKYIKKLQEQLKQKQGINLDSEEKQNLQKLQKLKISIPIDEY